MKKIAVVLSGSGYLDGTEITEAVSLLIALGQAGAHVTCFAPDIAVDAVDHLTKESSSSDRRRSLTEAGRIARGKVLDLETLRADDFDGLAFPGGFGAAKVLSNWAAAGARAEVQPDVARVIREFHKSAKPIAALCIAPTLLAKVLGAEKITVTIGDDRETAAEIEKTGAHHENCPVNDYVTDRESKILTSPAYMYDDAGPHEVFAGISALTKEFVEMA